MTSHTDRRPVDILHTHHGHATRAPRTTPHRPTDGTRALRGLCRSLLHQHAAPLVHTRHVCKGCRHSPPTSLQPTTPTPNSRAHLYSCKFIARTGVTCPIGGFGPVSGFAQCPRVSPVPTGREAGRQLQHCNASAYATHLPPPYHVGLYSCRRQARRSMPAAALGQHRIGRLPRLPPLAIAGGAGCEFPFQSNRRRCHIAPGSPVFPCHRSPQS